MSATIISASRLRRYLSVRQSLASSTAARMQLAIILLELPFQPLEQGEGVGGRAGEAADDLPSSPMRRTFFALGFITVLPIDTWPSPAMTVLPPFLTPEDRRSVPIFQSCLLWN